MATRTYLSLPDNMTRWRIEEISNWFRFWCVTSYIFADVALDVIVLIKPQIEASLIVSILHGTSIHPRVVCVDMRWEFIAGEFVNSLKTGILTLNSFRQQPLLSSRILLNHTQTAGYKKRQTNKLVHKPTFDEYDHLPGDEFQTVYKGYYDDKRHTDPRALDRFYRLNWGGWIRARGGRGNQSFYKDGGKMWWTKQHILCSDRQTEMLEKMFEQKYRKKKYFVDHPYEIYEERENFEFLPIGHSPYSYSYIKDKQ